MLIEVKTIQSNICIDILILERHEALESFHQYLHNHLRLID